ncbi:MAG: hypothetical protein WC943_15050 [Elusimicrobiota bacterium]
MISRIASLAALAALFAGLGAAADRMPERARLGGPPQLDAAVLLMAPSAGQDWARVVADVRASLGRRYLVESGAASDVKSLQSAVDRLQARKVKKIVAVPLLLSSHSAEMDENRYLFGIREKPSEAFLGGSHAHSGYSLVRRIRAKVPVVLTDGLDDHPVFAEILTDRALTQSKDASRESVVLVVPSFERDLANSQWAGTISALADRVRKTTHFMSVQTVFLPEDSAQSGRDKSEKILRETIRTLAETGRVIVVPLSLSRGPERRLRKLFEGLFVRFDGKAALPDKKICRWVEESLAKGAKLPDMRAYTKDEAPPAPPRQGRLSRPLLAPPSKAATSGEGRPESGSEAP